jgi:hypothetical protein
MLKTHPEWQMVNGKWKKPEHSAISHLPFSIRPVFVGPARGLDRLESGFLSQVFGQGRPRGSAALSSDAI